MCLCDDCISNGFCLISVFTLSLRFVYMVHAFSVFLDGCRKTCSSGRLSNVHNLSSMLLSQNSMIIIRLGRIDEHGRSII